MPRLFHIYSDFMGEGDMARRNRIAAASWKLAYQDGQWIPKGIKDSQLPRDATSIGSPKAVPFVKDLIDFGCQEANPDDYIVFTNMDTIFALGITDALLEQMKTVDSLSSHRYDFHDVTRPMRPIEVLMGEWYCGSDLFCFTKQWWLDHRNEYPDLILSFEAWDKVLRELVDITGGIVWNSGHILHIKHSAFWYRPDIKNSHPANLHNVRLARQFLVQNNKPLQELARRQLVHR